MKIHQIVSENLAKDAAIMSKVRRLPKQQQEAFRQLVTIDTKKITAGEENILDGKKYRWDGDQWQDKQTRKAVDPNTLTHLRLFVEDTDNSTAKLYFEAKNANLVKSIAKNYYKKNSASNDNDDENAFQSMVSTAIKATGRKAPAQDPPKDQSLRKSLSRANQKRRRRKMQKKDIEVGTNIEGPSGDSYEWKGAQWVNKRTGRVASRQVAQQLSQDAKS